jgi:hypothetical protein
LQSERRATATCVEYANAADANARAPARIVGAVDRGQGRIGDSRHPLVIGAERREA